MVEALRTVCGVNIVLAPMLAAQPPAPLTLRADKLTLGQALNYVARLEGVNWTLIDGAVYISRSGSSLLEPPPSSSAPPPIQPIPCVDASSLKGTVITANLDREMPKDKNVLWCASFQLAWNELMDYADGPVEMPGGPAWIASLNRRLLDRSVIDDASMIALAGAVQEGVLAKARRATAPKVPRLSAAPLAGRRRFSPQRRGYVLLPHQATAL